MANTLITLERIVGDRLTPIAAQLYQGGSAVNLTGLTVTFTMIADDGTAVVTEQAATLDVAASGKVSYGLAAVNVNTAGVFWMWFSVVGSGSKVDTFPNDGRKFKLIIHPKTQS